MFALHPNAFLPTFTSSSRRLPHSERDLKEIGAQISHSDFTRGDEILKVKQEESARKASKLFPKKRGCQRNEKIVVKKNPKKKVKTTVIEFEEPHEKDTSPTKWKDYKIKTLIAIRGEMDEEFARTTNKLGMNFFHSRKHCQNLQNDVEF